MQFTTDGGQVLRFEPSSITVASMDHMLRVDLVGANQVTPVSPDVASETSGASEGAQPFTLITYPDAWEGVTAVYEAKAGATVKSSFFVAGGLDGQPTDQIRLRYNRPVLLDAQGNLVIAYDHGTMTDSAPVAWQEIDGRRRPVEVHYVLHGDNEVGFTVGNYDHGRKLVIDPTLTWNTFLGGSGGDFAYALTVDIGGNVYLAGYSSSTWGSPVRAFSSGNDIFVAKLNSSGGLVWNTFLGGSGSDQAFGITVDGSGNAFVTGQSNADWGSPVRAYGGVVDAFAAKLNSSGTLTWNTFLGGGGSDYGYGVAVDGNDNLYLAGNSTVGWGSPVRAYSGNADAFVTKLNSSGTLTWVTFLGGTGSDGSRGVAVDGSGNVYVAGYSSANWGSPVRAYSSDFDMMAAKLNGSGSLTWNTFLGGSGYEVSEGGVLDAGGNFYLTGRGNTNWGSPVQGYSGGNFDLLAVKVNSSGSLEWNTFAGGTGLDYGYGIAVVSGSIQVTGSSDAAWGSPWRAYSSGTDGFVAEFNTSNGSRTAHAFLGGSGSDVVYEVAANAGGDAYVAGHSSATWGSPILSYSSGFDAFVAKITSDVSGYFISGTVFEDVNYGGGPGRDYATSLAQAGPFVIGRDNVTVELYDAVGAFQSSTTTALDGSYSFTGLAPAFYTVRVVNNTVTSSRAGSNGTEILLQTFRIDADGEGLGTGSLKVGGEFPSNEGAASNSGAQILASLQGTDIDLDGVVEWTQSIVTVDASGTGVAGVDFGFNADTIVNTNDSGQGSLRQFILNANLLSDQASLSQASLTAGRESSIFMIPSSTDPLGRPVDPGFDAGRGVAVIAPVSEMDALVDSGTFLDGTTQTVNIGDTNPGDLGYVGPVGLGVDGVIATGDEPTLSGVAAPEIEVKGNATLEFGLRLQGSDIILRGLAVYGFGISGLDANILVGHHSLVTNNTNCRIEANVLGTMADSFTDPGLGARSPAINIYVRTADQGAIVGNLLGYVGRENVRILSTALNWQVTDNEIRAGGRETTFGGVTYIADATGELKRNLIADDNATAVLGINTDLEIENNTISGNLDGAIGFFDNSGSMVTTASVLQNDLTGNGSGVVVFGENGASPAITGIRISRNRFSDNAWNAIDLVTSWTPDGISVNDGTLLGDSSVPNSCGTVPTTGNIGLDTPLLDSAVITTGTTTINGRACPGVEVEIYRAVADGDASDTAGGTDYGEGVEFLDATTADGAGDWTIMSTALAVGDHISAIAIDASGNTSEFGPNLQVSGTSLSGIVFEDVDFAGTAADYDGGVADRPLVNVDVELYNGTTDAYIASTTTTAGGVFAFGSIANGTYKIRVRSETLGDADTQPTGGFNPSVPGTWPFPLAEMTWGNGSALIGGQDPTVDDTVTGDNAGPGDTYVSVTLSGADVTGVNMGFNFELIVNDDDDANPDVVRSKQGTLRQFIKNSNAIVGVNKSWFQIPSP